MSNFKDSWMSCRQPHSRSTSSRIELLPTWSTPPLDHALPADCRPPAPSYGNSGPCVCLLCVGAFLCAIGGYVTIAAAAGPIAHHSSSLARGTRAPRDGTRPASAHACRVCRVSLSHVVTTGLSTAVGNAISHANQEAERSERLRYEARERYMSRRRSGTTKATSPLLLRLAALRRDDDQGRVSIDDGAVEQLFPDWVTERAAWDESVVLKDLVLAVSQISHSLSMDSGAEVQ